jgi:hypothetical protein
MGSRSEEPAAAGGCAPQPRRAAPRRDSEVNELSSAAPSLDAVRKYSAQERTEASSSPVSVTNRIVLLRRQVPHEHFCVDNADHHHENEPSYCGS